MIAALVENNDSIVTLRLNSGMALPVKRLRGDPPTTKQRKQKKKSRKSKKNKRAGKNENGDGEDVQEAQKEEGEVGAVQNRPEASIQTIGYHLTVSS